MQESLEKPVVKLHTIGCVETRLVPMVVVAVAMVVVVVVEEY